MCCCQSGTDGAGVLETDKLSDKLGTGWDVTLFRVQLLCVEMVAAVLPSLL